MTIYRIGPDPDAAPQYRVDLGRILVTIDDIESLMTYLGRHEKDSDPIVVEFNAGYFTEARDLSKITPLEIRFLRLKNSKVLVVLGASFAEAIGDFQETQGVYNCWARSLVETKQLPPRVRKDRITTVVLAGLLVIVGTFSCGASILFQRSYYQFGHLYLSVGSVFNIIGFLTFAFSIYVLYRWDKEFKRSTYAIIVPHSRDEHHRNELSQKYPRRSWIVAIIASVIAAISIVANIWLVLMR